MNKAIFLTAVLSLSFGAYSAPKTANEKYFNEGTETTLSKQQVQEILPWAQNTRALLSKLLATSKRLTYLDKTKALINGIREGVLSSAPHNTELAMRYVLNRANKIYTIMRTSPHANEPMMVDAQIHLLETSVKMAISYYKSDMEALKQAKEGKVVSNIDLRFATYYQNFLGIITQFNLDPKVNYQIQYLRVSFFQWDLYRLKDNKKFANSILGLTNLVNTYRKTPPQNDQQAINLTSKLNADFNVHLKQMGIIDLGDIAAKELGSTYIGEWVVADNHYTYCFSKSNADKIRYPIDESFCNEADLVGEWLINAEGQFNCYPVDAPVGTYAIYDKYCKDAKAMGVWVAKDNFQLGCYPANYSADTSEVDKKYCPQELQGEWITNEGGIQGCYIKDAPAGAKPLDPKFCPKK